MSLLAMLVIANQVNVSSSCHSLVTQPGHSHATINHVHTIPSSPGDVTPSNHPNPNPFSSSSHLTLPTAKKCVPFTPEEEETIKLVTFPTSWFFFCSCHRPLMQLAAACKRWLPPLPSILPPALFSCSSYLRRSRLKMLSYI